MSKIRITLTAYNMGGECDERDFQAWQAYVCDHIMDDVSLSDSGGICEVVVDLHPFHNGPDKDTVTGGTDKQQENIREYLSGWGWDAFCGDDAAWPKRD